MEAKGEATNERRDRHWRRWTAFVRDWGLGDDPFLDSVPGNDERTVLARGFVMSCRLFNFDRQGKITTEREKPMVSTSLRDAIGGVASAFRDSGRPSPFHISVGVHGQGSIHPRIRALLVGSERKDPLPRRQKALTPEFLLDMHKFTRSLGKEWQHTSDLIRGAFFFAMRACEFCKTESPGRTRRLTRGNITFRGKDNDVLNHQDPDLASKAKFVTICFVDQKNGMRMEKRSQKRSGVPILCPIEAWASVVGRHSTDYAGVTGEKIPVSFYKANGRNSEVTASQVTKLLRKICDGEAGSTKYSFKSEEIGTRSIRSGAAMSLAVQGGHTDEKIRILGRWKSLAFLRYIRPQVLEWSGGMAADMARTKSFTDVSEPIRNQTDQKKPTATRQAPIPSNQAEDSFPSFRRFDLD